MHENKPNRFICCDTQMPTRFNYCPQCGTEIPWRPDTAEDIAERKRLEVLKGCKTRMLSLAGDIQRMESQTARERHNYDEQCFPWTHSQQIESMKRDFHSLALKSAQLERSKPRP